jgi:Tfp pilus assembly protein PilF
MMRKRNLIAILALSAALLLCARGAAASCTVLVFDFEDRSAGRDSAWVGPALADFLINTLTVDARCKAVPRLAVKYHSAGGALPFERKWELLDAMKADVLVEGSYSVKGGAMSFQGTVVRTADSDIQDISFSLNPFSPQAARKRLLDSIGKILKIEFKNNSDATPGARSEKAYEAYWKADAALGRGDAARADTLLSEALAQDPAMAAACALRGRILLESADYDKAAERLEKCLSVNADYPDTHYYLGQVYAAQKKLAAARTHLRAAADARPANPLFQWKLGAFYRESSVFDKALDTLNKAVSLDAALAPAWYELALIHAYAKNRDKALGNLGKAVKLGGGGIADMARTAPEFEWLRRDTRFFDILRSAPR